MICTPAHWRSMRLLFLPIWIWGRSVRTVQAEVGCEERNLYFACYTDQSSQRYSVRLHRGRLQDI
jgi:hypothetical protein